jgi:uncharacterized membrane protein
MVGNRAGEVKLPQPSLVTLGSLYWSVTVHSDKDDNRKMADSRIKPYQQQAAEDSRRAQQRRLYRRNQVFGLLIVAAVIVVWWLIHTQPGWIFPRGWWRP